MGHAELDVQCALRQPFDGPVDEGGHALLQVLGGEGVGGADHQVVVTHVQGYGTLEESVEGRLRDLYLELPQGRVPEPCRADRGHEPFNLR